MPVARFAAFAVCFGSPALADLTAEEVLADHLNLLSGYGLIEMTAIGTTVTPDGLSVESFRGTYVDDDSGDEVTYSLPGVSFIEQSDGAVQVVYPETLPLTVATDTEEEGQQSATIIFELTDMVHLVSDVDGAFQHDVTAGRIAFAGVEGYPLEELQKMDGTLALDGLDSTLRFVDGSENARNLEFSFDRFLMEMAGDDFKAKPSQPNTEGDGTKAASSQLEAMEATIDLVNASGVIGYVDSTVPQHLLDLRFDRLDWDQKMDMSDGEGMDLTFGVANMDMGYDIALSIDALDTDGQTALSNGQFARFKFRYDGLQSDVSMNMPEAAFSMQSSNGAADVSFSFDDRGIGLSASVLDTVASITTPFVPDFPIQDIGYELGALRYGFQMPILMSEGAQAFGFEMALEGLTVADPLWNLFDPEARIPRDPIDLVVDLNGSTVVTENSFLAGQRVAPFANTKAALEAFRLAVGGAVLTGTGSFEDTSTPDQPRGIGELSAVLVGGNTLMDTLVDMGLLDTNQAMAARMALGVVARAGDGPDTLVSDIEVNEAGEIFANGQRIK